MAIAATSEWTPVDNQDGLLYRVYTKPLVKSGQDDRDYRLIQLNNGLQAILVHDAKADKAAASLDVAVGHLFDPVSLPQHLLRKRSQSAHRMTCLDLPIFVNISFSWFVSTPSIPLFHETSWLSQGTERFPKENEYSEVRIAV
jgi:hypothetical protein